MVQRYTLSHRKKEAIFPCLNIVFEDTFFISNFATKLTIYYMKIEEEIKQTTFRNPLQKAMINLFFTNNWIEAKLKAILEPYGVTMQQFNVLRILRGQYPNYVSTSNIRERLIDQMSDVSRIVDRLGQKEWVEKFACKADRRLVDIRISEKGLDLLKKIDDVELSFDSIVSNISEDEADILNLLLDKIRNND